MKELYKKTEKLENNKEGFSYDLQEYVCRLILSTKMVGQIGDEFICDVLKDITKRKKEHAQEIFAERQKIAEARKGMALVAFGAIPDLFRSLSKEERKELFEFTKKVWNMSEFSGGWFMLEEKVAELPHWKLNLISNFAPGDVTIWLLETYQEGKLEELLLSR